MKKLMLIIIIILELIVFKIPKYVELNNLAIIDTIGIIKEKNQYTLILKEIIPIKDNQGITYKYKYYEKKKTTIKKAYKCLSDEISKKIYLNKVKNLITNTKDSEGILKELDINPKTILHTNQNIKDIIKKNY